MKFKIDENLPVEFAQVLQAAGHDASTILEEQLSGAPDPEVMAVSISENRAIVTLDLDFADIRLYPPEDHPGIIVFRVQPQDKERLLRCLTRVVPFLETEPVNRTLWIVEEDRIRIRPSSTE
jgi:predicted nuclease of predicted toxin-antitoxin system